MPATTLTGVLDLDAYVTIDEGARIKGVSYDALRMYLNNHNVSTIRVGGTRGVILVKRDDVNEYKPMRARGGRGGATA